MEGIKEFLESSTIHGLTYISTIRNPLIKLFWIGVVTVGFVTSIFLINRSFTDWENSPIATTIETFPISKSIFPKITVCPPKRSITPLNYGLIKAENITLDNDTRHELIKLTQDWFDVGMLNDEINVDNSFKENEKSRKWYEGHSKVTLPYDAYTVDNHGQVYFMDTSATSGNLSTPWFGDPFTAEKFEKWVRYDYNIHFPTNISTMASNMNIVVVMMLDTKETVGSNEYVGIHPPSGYDNEHIQYTGKMRKTWRYQVTNKFTENDTLRIVFYRSISKLDKSDMDYYTYKTMTGMSIEWFVEDGNGVMMEVEQQGKYLEDKTNKMYIKMVNLLYTAVQIMNMSEHQVWMKVKSVRRDWISGNYNRDCNYEDRFGVYGAYSLVDADIKNLIEAVINKTKIKTPLPTTPVYKVDITTSLLDTAHQMFVYLAHCPRRDRKINDWMQFYSNMFNNFPPRTILQNIVNINKVAAPFKKKEHFVTVKLVEHLDTILDLHYRTIALALSTQTELLGGDMMKNFYSDVGKCFNRNMTTKEPDEKCQSEMEKMNTIGN